MSSLNVGTLTLSNGLTLPSYTSSPDNRPSHGAGKTIYDSTSDTIQVSDGTQWISAGSAGSGLVTATGGEITFAGGYKVHTWYNVGEYNFQVQGAASGATVEVLVCAGGGSGGTIGGGGGGGGVAYNGTYPVSVGSYPVKVGAGGSTPLSGYPVAKGTSGALLNLVTMKHMAAVLLDLGVLMLERVENQADLVAAQLVLVPGHHR